VSLRVNEIFYSIQGESSYAGRPCVFVRLTGCNLRCAYCDTQYAYEEGNELEVFEILDLVASYECPLVEITGGEPLIQEDTPDLIYNLLENGYHVLLETNGSLDTAGIDARCVKIIDVKCPSSGEHEKNNPKTLTKLTEKDEIKFVIGDRPDYEYARQMLMLMRQDTLISNPVHFSPVYGKMDLKILSKWILQDHLDVGLNLQLHKVIWGPEKRGV